MSQTTGASGFSDYGMGREALGRARQLSGFQLFLPFKVFATVVDFYFLISQLFPS